MIKNAYAEENFTEILSCQVHDGFEWRDKREKFLAMKPTQTDKKKTCHLDLLQVFENRSTSPLTANCK